MKGAAAVALLGLAALQQVEAECPNACSGHGVCGEFDACYCYPDWGGGDCAQRFCPSNWAWITTNSNGDLNADKDRDDFTIYDTDHTFKNSGLDYIVSQNNPSGDFESWPGYANQADVDEGHFYMECSNMGICDRTTGMCQCFQGYTGAGCRRSRCPNDCSGHGVCKTVGQQLNDNDYVLWDKDMSRSCVCDGGYSGPDCSQRKCGFGDDPLTTGQVNEKQWVDVYTPWESNAIDNTFAGYIKLTYTDYNGVEWTTDGIEVVPYTSKATGETMAAAVEAALNGLPDDVLSGVTVKAGYIEEVIPGNVQSDGAALSGATNAATAINLVTDVSVLRCPITAEVDDDADEHKLFRTTGTDQLAWNDGAVTLAAKDDATCYSVKSYWGVRFEISFTSTPGNLAKLEVDISQVTINGKTNAQRDDQKAVGVVSEARQLGVAKTTDGIVVSYVHPGTVSADLAAGTGGIDSATKTVTIDDTTQLFAGARITLECKDTSASNKKLGTFTIDSVADGTTFTVVEDIPECAAGGTVSVKYSLASWAIKANADLRGVLAAGDILTVQTFKSTTPKVSSISWDAASGVGYVFLESEYLGTGDNGANGEADTDGLETVEVQGDATSEMEECSARGLCDRETGICTCFRGYTGWACSIQNALSL